MTGALMRNTLLGAVAGAATTLATFVGGVVVARLLGPEGAGVVAYALWCIGVAVTVADLGVGMAFQRYIPELNAKDRRDEGSRLVGLLARLSLLSVLATALLLFAWLQYRSGEAAPADRLPVGLVLAAFVAQAFGGLYTAYLKGGQRFGSLARLSLATSSVQLAVLTAGAWWFGTAGALAGYVAAPLLPALLGFPLFLFRGTVPAKLKRRVARFALASWSAAVIGTLVWTRSEILFLEAYAGLNAVGLFAVATTLTGMATALPMLLTGALVPYFSEQHGLGAHDRVQAAYRNTTLVIALLVLPGCFGMAAIAPVLVPLLFGSDFGAAAPVAMILLVPAAIGVVAAGATSLIYGTEKSSILVLSNLVGLAGTIALGFLAIPPFGLLGAAWTRAAVHMIVVAIETWYLSRRLGFDPPWRALGAVAFAAALSGLAARLPVEVVGGPVSLLLAIPVAVLVFALALRLFQVLRMLDPVLLRRAADEAPGPARPLVAMMLRLLSPALSRPQAPHA